jgi:hypothetical protein
MIRTAVIFTFVAFALGSSSDAGNVQVNFSGGSGGPLTITLPQAVSFTVTNDTASVSANFVFQGVGNVLGSSVRGAAGSMSYTTNGGSALSINSVGNFNLGVVTTNDLTIFKSASPGVNLGDVLVLSNGSVTTTTNVSAAAPPSGLYSAIFVDADGTQLGGGNAVPAPFGDYNLNGLVDAADYIVWRKTDGNAAAYNVWRSHFGQSSGSGAGVNDGEFMSTAVPEPGSASLVCMVIAFYGAWTGRGRRSRKSR